MKQSKFALMMMALATVAFLCTLSLGAAAQDVTHPSKTETTGPATHTVYQTAVKNAEVIHVSGHEIVLEREDGGFELLKLAPDFQFLVDGKYLTVHELKPGMKLTQEIHTVSTPQEVSTLRTVDGKVWHVSAPHVILEFPDGTHKQYTVPDDTVFNIDGQKKTVFDLRKGMVISATVLKTEPLQHVSTHTVVTGQAPPDVPFEGPILLEPAMREAAPAAAAAVEKPAEQEQLPATGSFLPLIGFSGLFLLVTYGCLRIIRRNAS